MSFSFFSKREDSQPSRLRLALTYILFLAVSIAVGTFIAWLAVLVGKVDKFVIGPLLPPLAISISFVLFLLSAVAMNRRRIVTLFDAFLSPEEKGLRAIVIIAAVFASYEILRIFLFMFIDYWPTDMPSYHYAGLALKQGTDPYNPSNLTELAGNRVFPYLYPPLLAILWIPFAELPLEIVLVFWQIVTLAALAGSMALCLRLAEPSTSTSRAAALVCTLLLPLGHPFYEAARHGSVSVVFAFLLILFFERLAKRRDRSAGIVLALACGIKALPALLLFYLILKRRFKALLTAMIAGTVLLGASVLIAGWEVHWRFITDVIPEIGYGVHSELGFDPTFHPQNQSLNGFVTLVICAAKSGCSLVVIALCLLFIAPLAWLCAKRPTIDGAEASAIVITLLLISPITWFHHLVLLLLPGVVLATCVVQSSWRPKLWPVAAVAFAVIMAHDFGRPVMPVRFFVFWSHARFFMLLLLYITSWFLLKSRKTNNSQ
ncbi:MAG: DUF2029 domain-containing protein [Proteobacteria bacterium]|nr:DUF2029 domain-containing protein [Pseudomonadota bacterium]